MDFQIDPELRDIRDQVRAFVAEHVIPAEAQLVAEDQADERDLLERLRQRVRDAGLWTPHLPEELGGRGLGVMGMSVLFREMGRSLAGPVVFNCDAPDQGNMDLLARKASPAVRERWLRPLCEGRITSAFCMTEPAPGAGADPRNLRTRATRDGDGWVIDGHKWYATGAGRSSFLIVMARTSDDPYTGATLFVVDTHAEGVEHVRDIPVLAEPLFSHREAELRFHSVRVGDDAILGGVGQGFLLAQARLVPARLTHCMRWLGLADRVLELCRDYITTRESFGKTLSRHQAVQHMIAENAIAIHAGNLMTTHCAWLIHNGETGRHVRAYSSMAKLHVARLLGKVLDDAIQMHGALGFSDDMPFARWSRHARSARIADGPDEVHLMVIARDWIKRELSLLVG